MVTPQALQEFIDAIPPKPEVLHNTINYVEQGELVKAAKEAQKDAALASYLRNFVNRPSFYLKKEVKELTQVFGILGVTGAKELLYHYMLHLFSPKQWKLFSLNVSLFTELQTQLSTLWKRVLDKKQINDACTTSLVTLLPASIVVTEMLFEKHIKEVQLLRENQHIDYNTILERLVGVDLFDIAMIIAQTWQMDEKTIKLIPLISGKSTKEHPDIILAQYLHMILFYVLSKPEFVQSDLNDFLDFEVEFVSDIIEDFDAIVEETA